MTFNSTRHFINIFQIFKVYLGLGCKVGEKSWRISNTKKHTSFLRDLGGYIWKKREIVTCCLDLKKSKKFIT